MAKPSPYETGELTDSIFLILLATQTPIHGYKIMQKVSEITNGVVEIGPATMYTTLAKLKDAGWIYEKAEIDSKKVYQITDKGVEISRKNFNYRKALVDVASELLGGE